MEYTNNLLKQIIALQEENEQLKLRLSGVVRQSEQYCECGWFEKGEKKELNSYLVCKHCDKFL